MRSWQKVCVLFVLSGGSVERTTPDAAGQDVHAARACTRPSARHYSEGETVVLREERTFPCKIAIVDAHIALVADSAGFVTNIGQKVEVDAQGRFYTYTGFGDVSVWAADGRFIQKIGRKGDGPGELTGGNLDFQIDGAGRVYIRDNHPRWTILSPNLEFVRTANASGMGSEREQAAFLDTGELLTAAPSSLDAQYYFHVYDFAKSEPADSVRGARRSIGGGPALVRSFGAILMSERSVRADQRVRSIGYSGGSTFWAGPPQGAGRGYQLELWSLDGRRLRTIQRAVHWLPTRPIVSVRRGETDIPPPEFEILDDDGSGLLYVTIVAANARWNPMLDVRDPAKRRELQQAMVDVCVEVIDVNAGIVMASTGLLRPAEAERVYPSGLFRRSHRGFQRIETNAGYPMMRIVEYQLVSAR